LTGGKPLCPLDIVIVHLQRFFIRANRFAQVTALIVELHVFAAAPIAILRKGL
jgi:hypothetical protein